MPATADYYSNDTQSAEDNFQFLQAFFAAYPEFASNDFYLAGESYAGVYVPSLAYRISQAAHTTFTLQGFMVGNGCTGNMVGICGYYFNGQVGEFVCVCVCGGGRLGCNNGGQTPVSSARSHAHTPSHIETG